MNLASADDLLKYTGGNASSILSYNGYDYKGNVLTSQPTLNDFFKAKDANGNYPASWVHSCLLMPQDIFRTSSSTKILAS
jgi:hypothetical protein